MEVPRKFLEVMGNPQKFLKVLGIEFGGVILTSFPVCLKRAWIYGSSLKFLEVLKVVGSSPKFFEVRRSCWKSMELLFFKVLGSFWTFPEVLGSFWKILEDSGNF